jgi:hypothetical protein
MITFPKFLTRNDLRQCLSLARALIDSEESVVPVDASHLQFIDPFGLTLLAAASERLAEMGQAVDVVALNPRYGSYLARMDLFKQPWMRCSAMAGTTRNELGTQLVELKRLTKQREVDEVANALAVAILGRITGLDQHAPRDEMTCTNAWDHTHEPLCHALSEVLQNALTHARRDGCDSANTWVAAQYMPKTDAIHIGIVDTGCGFLGSLRNHPKLTQKTDRDAMNLALQPRISCNREFGRFDDAVNAGIGLTTTFRLTREAQGQMLLVSGNCARRTESQTQAVEVEALTNSWRGVAVAIELKRSALANIDIRRLMPPREGVDLPPPVRFE